MNKKAIVFAVAACLGSGAALAQSYGYHNDGYRSGAQYDARDRNQDGYVDRYERRISAQRGYRASHDGRNQHNYRSGRHNRSGQVQVQVYSTSRHNQGYGSDQYGRVYNNGQYGQGYGSNQYGQVYSTDQYGRPSHYQMRRGERLANQYRHNRYVVNDWRSHDLYQPQYGHQWIQAGTNYAMVAIATGIIAQVLMNR